MSTVHSHAPEALEFLADGMVLALGGFTMIPEPADAAESLENSDQIAISRRIVDYRARQLSLFRVRQVGPERADQFPQDVVA